MPCFVFRLCDVCGVVFWCLVCVRRWVLHWWVFVVLPLIFDCVGSVWWLCSRCLCVVVFDDVMFVGYLFVLLQLFILLRGFTYLKVVLFCLCG